MIQAESMRLGCVCPECGTHCSDCLGTDTVISRDAFRKLKEDPAFARRYAADMAMRPEEEPADMPAPDEMEKLRGD
jgi:hypothetical protein